jgi:hypothetical protein
MSHMSDLQSAIKCLASDGDAAIHHRAEWMVIVTTEVIKLIARDHRMVCSGSSG